MEVDPAEVDPQAMVEAVMEIPEIVATGTDENTLDSQDSPDVPEKADDPDYEPEVIPLEDEDESELSLAERLKFRRRRRGRSRKGKYEPSHVPQILPRRTRRSVNTEPVVQHPKVVRTYSKNSNINQLCTLVMECDSEDLSDAQLAYQMECKREFNQAQDKINEMIKNKTILFQAKHTMVLQSGIPNHATMRTVQTKITLPKTAPSVVKVNPLTSSQINPLQPNILRTQTRQNIIIPATGQTGNVTYLLPGGKTGTVLRTFAPGQTVRLAGPKIMTTMHSAPPPIAPAPIVPTPISTVAIAPMPNQLGANAETVDLTLEDTVDSREISFNKLSGKTFPSLVVMARPNLRAKEMTPSVVTKDRSTLDAKVKMVLVHSPAKFTEWLIQQGLVRSEQVCSMHRDQYGNSIKLKLGMYSDNTKFPFSGGYVWISECCPQKFVSVFSGSLFESSPHPPTVLLKLIYHWCCQTSVNNVVQWVKVDNFYVKNFYTLVRAVCTAAIHTKLGHIGGIKSYVEVGVISLGTTTQDGHQRQVKVEVLGVMDYENKKVRLMAVEPMAESERNLRRRFSKILEPLSSWVHPASTILTDFSIDKSTLQALGFNNVYQNIASEAGTMLGGQRRNNANIMDYLRKVVPKIFLNTLSLLNRNLIQQFLDELTWRESWGYSPPQAFDNIIAHLAEQTKVDYGEPLVTRLGKVAVNPFNTWNYLEQSRMFASSLPVLTQLAPTPDFDVTPSALCEVQYAPGPAHSKRPRAQKTPQPIVNEKNLNASAASAIKRVKLNTSAQTYLDAYYYADMAGQSALTITDQDSSFNVKCIICPNTFYNNVALQKHLISHVVYETNDIQKLPKDIFCPYCLKKLTTQAQLTSHKKDSHMLNTASTSCCICQKKFPVRAHLIQHMHKSHVASEIPYRCHICHFRSSVHHKVVDHFYETHTGGGSLQCPLCLKVYYASGPRSRSSTTNLMSFYQHLVGHKRQSNRRKCERCCLTFQQSKHVYEHEDQDHRSMKSAARVIPVVSTESNPTIIIPTPTCPPPVSQADKAGDTTWGSTGSPRVTNYTKWPHNPELNIRISSNKFKCIECKRSMNPDEDMDHFSNFINCLKCRFSTCCLYTMENHIIAYHTGKKKNKPKSNPGMILPEAMYCICGFKSKRGNELADHLDECEKKSAYPKPGIQAQSASFPPLINLDEGISEEDQNDKWMQAYVNKSKDEEREKQEKPDDGSIMGFLGLVRKPSTEDESAKKAEAEVEKEDSKGGEAANEVSLEAKEDPDPDFDDDEMPPILEVETEVKVSDEVMELGE
ncbi:uncharacterized protein row [Cloeon dipterum]|uniref:uncharacterized protein row n=1 Tax=Cloeon dipterum TaxID=197152 RepID=UPI00321FC18C